MNKSKLNLITIILLFISGIIYGYNSNKANSNVIKEPNHITDPKILNKIPQSIELIKNSPDKEAYNVLMGKNPTNKKITVNFKDLRVIDERFENYEAIGHKGNFTGDLYIYINVKNKEEPIEALAALIAGQTTHIDKEISQNEETYALCKEGYLWTYLENKNPTLREKTSHLVQREVMIKKLLEKGNFTSKYPQKTIEANEAYRNFPKESTGYSNEELTKKLEKLKEVYNY